MDKYFIVYTNDSKQVLGVVLTQKGGVVAYASRNLKKNEDIYVTHELELIAMILGMKL